MHHLRLHELNMLRCPDLDWQKFLAFFFLLGAFYSKMFKWGRQGAYRTIPSLSEDLLFLLLTVRHILVQICVCVRLYFIWGRQILCILVRLKSFQNSDCHKKKITVSWNRFLYDIIPQCGKCMFIWKMIGG